MSRSFVSIRSVLSLICTVGFLNQVHAMPEAEELKATSTNHSKSDGWKSARSELKFRKKGDQSLLGDLVEKSMQLDYPHVVLEKIKEICMEDSRWVFVLETDAEAALEAQKELMAYKTELIQQLLNHNPATSKEAYMYQIAKPLSPEQEQQHNSLRIKCYEFAERPFTCQLKTPQCRGLADELPDMSQSVNIGKMPQVIALEDLYLLKPAILADWYAFSDHSSNCSFFSNDLSTNFMTRKRREFLSDLMDSFYRWSIISPEIALNRLDVFLSVCKNDQMRNYFLEGIGAQHAEFRANTPHLRKTLDETFEAFQAYVKKNYKPDPKNRVDRKNPEHLARDPFHQLMRVTPTPVYRAYFAGLLQYDFEDIKEYLSPDFPLDLDKSNMDSIKFFRDIFPGYAISPLNREYKMRMMIDCLKIMYHREGLDTPPTHFTTILHMQETTSRHLHMQNEIILKHTTAFPSHGAAQYALGNPDYQDDESKARYEKFIAVIQADGESVLRQLNLPVR